ncbi:MAG: FlgD immunoglobulin-like domain containing protein [bacterium]
MKKHGIGIVLFMLCVGLVYASVSTAEEKSITTETSTDISVFVIQRAAELSGLFNFPNPFNPNSSDSDQNRTTFVYALTQNSKVTIDIYNSVGDLVRRLEYASGATGGTGSSGGYTNRVTWDGRNGDGMIVANGMYIAQIMAEPTSGGDSSKTTRKIAVLK